MLRACLGAVAVCLLCLQQDGAVRAVAASQDRDGGPKTATAGQLIISEFRLRGPNGTQDEFIEIYNASNADHTVAAASGTGYGIAASDGVTRCSIPNGTVIPNRGHFLCVNSNGYSLTSYPAGSATTATGDATYTTDIPDNVGIAIFNNDTGGGSYSLANRLDAVGSTSEGDATYKEGLGYPALGATSANHSFTRRTTLGCNGSAGGGNCTSILFMQTTPPTTSSALADSNNNATDFIFVDTNGTLTAAGQRLGAPGPENLSSPVAKTATGLAWSRLDTCAPMLAAPNKLRDVTSDPGNNSTFGTYDIRRTWTNKTGLSFTRLRFRIVDISTFPSIAGVADLRARSSGNISILVDRPPCGSGTSSVFVNGTTLETPPAQPNGGGFNATLSVDAVTPGAPLPPGGSINVRFLLGIQQTGIARFCVVPELPPSTQGFGQILCFIGDTESDIVPAVADIDFDQKSDVPLYDTILKRWSIFKSSSGFVTPTTLFFVNPGWTPLIGDYDGDGRMDEMVYIESTGEWLIAKSSTNYAFGDTYSWGGPGYEPMPGDYDGDGMMDLAVYNAATHSWYILTSTTSFTSSLTISWGGPGYTAVPGQDFDGDNQSDLVVYYQRTGAWYVLKSSTNFTTALVKAWGGPGYTLVPGDYDGDGKADFGLYQRRTGLWYILKSSSSYTTSLTINSGGMGFQPMPGDYDGDGKIDPGWYQLAATKFYALTSSTAYGPGSAIQKTLGVSGSPIAPSVVVPRSSREIDEGDFDGDFISDLTVYNTTTGVWSILKSNGGFTSATSIGWGGTGYDPVPGDYDGDGQGDLGLYQPSTGTWLVLLSSSNFTTSLNKSNGGPGYIPMAGDYDGDGKTDIVTYNPTTGLWFGLKSSTSYTTIFSVMWGGAGYTAAPGDFDGDGRLDLTVYNSVTGLWSVLTSSSNYVSSIVRNLGGAGYGPVPADYDGDGFTDFAVYQPSTGVWTLLKSTSGYTIGLAVGNGGPGWVPVPGDWDDDGRADIGVYNTTTGAWSILLSNGTTYTSSLSKNWGGAGYAPVPVFP